METVVERPRIYTFLGCDAVIILRCVSSGSTMFVFSSHT